MYKYILRVDIGCFIKDSRRVQFSWNFAYGDLQYWGLHGTSFCRLQAAQFNVYQSVKSSIFSF